MRRQWETSCLSPLCRKTGRGPEARISKSLRDAIVDRTAVDRLEHQTPAHVQTWCHKLPEASGNNLEARSGANTCRNNLIDSFLQERNNVNTRRYRGRKTF